MCYGYIAAVDEHVKWPQNGSGRKTTGVDVVTWQRQRQQHRSAGHHGIADAPVENGIVRPQTYHTMSPLQTSVPMVPASLSVHTVPGFGGGDMLLGKESPGGSSRGSGSGPYQVETIKLCSVHAALSVF